MEKRVLIIASVASMIGQFNRDNISLLQEMGYKVDVACNFKKGSTFSEESAKRLKKELIEQGVRSIPILPLSQSNWWSYRKNCGACNKNKNNLYSSWISFL